MVIVGKIDLDIYKCVCGDITTDEVVLTEERIAHIKERHPSDYEKYTAYLSEIVREPDYILEANKPNTAFVLKHIEREGEQFELILRLQTAADIQGHQNSIITFLRVDQKRYRRYLRTKKILYKRK